MRSLAFFAAIVSVSAFSCQPKLDTARTPVDDGSFGTTVYTLTCKRLSYQLDLADGDTVDVRGDAYRDMCRTGQNPPPQPYPAVEALAADRAPIIASVDTTFPDADLESLQAYLTSNEFLATYDDGKAEASIERLAALFDVMADDPDFAPAFARLEGRPGYRPIGPALGALRSVVDWDGFEEMLLVLIDAIAPGGAAHGEFLSFQRAIARELADSQPAPDRGMPDRTLDLSLSLLLGESPLLGTGTPRPLVRRDLRGLAYVAADPATGDLPEPFADVDGDGWADADSYGRFVDDTGAPLFDSVPPPFATPYQADTAVARDAAGRALTFAGGPEVYDYVDLDRTVLGALVREGHTLFDPLRGTALDLLRGASAILGPRLLTSHTYTDGSAIEYRGYDTSASPLLEMLYGFLLLFTDPNIDDTLGLAKNFLVNHEPEASRLIEAMVDLADAGDGYPDAKLRDSSALYDDLIPVVNEILQVPGLAEDLLQALEDPAVRNLDDRFREFMTYKDQLDYDPDTQQIVGSLATPVDRSQPDSNWNRSLLQRLVHLIADSSGVTMCNKEGAVIRDPLIGVVLATYSACEMLQIDDLAVFYAQSIAYQKDAFGNVVYDSRGLPVPKAVLPLDIGWLDSIVTDDLMESESTITGFRRHPTPEALNRVLFLDPSPAFIQDTMDPAVCKDGDRYIDAHSGTLPVWELNGFYDQIRPLIQAFADHNAESLFVDILVTVHMHYPSEDSIQHQDVNPSGHGYAKQSDIHAWEPFLIHILDDMDFWSALTETAATLASTPTPSGKGARAALVDAGRYLFGPRPGLTKRLGGSTTTTGDGRTVSTLSPWYVLADAYALKRTRVEEAGGEGDAWERSVGQVVDSLVRGEQAGPTWRFRNPRFRGVSAAMVDFLRARIAAHRAAGDLDGWAKQELPNRTEELMSGPVFAGAADFILSLQAAPAARAALEELQVYLASELVYDEAFQTALTVVADLMQLYQDDPDVVPVARVLGRAMDPDFGLVDSHLLFTQEARHADTGGVLHRLLRNLLTEIEPGRTALSQIVDSVCEVQRTNPYAERGRPMSAEDFRSTFRAASDFLFDERRSLNSFIQIVANRHAHE
jgi:hypothetical protein